MLICHLLQEEVGQLFPALCQLSVALNFLIELRSVFSEPRPRERTYREMAYTLEQLGTTLRQAALLHTEEAQEHCVVYDAAYLQVEVLVYWEALVLETAWLQWAVPPLHTQGQVDEEAVEQRNTLKYSGEGQRTHNVCCK